MQQQHYKGILYFITGVILVTLGMQVYWNYKNYLSGKQQLINEVQISLDNAVDGYYADLAEENILGISFSDNAKEMSKEELDKVFLKIESKDSIFPSYKHKKLDAIDPTDLKSISIFSGESATNFDTLFKRVTLDKATRKELIKWNFQTDSIKEGNPLLKLTSKVIFAISNDSLQLEKLNGFVGKELTRKNIKVTYDLAYTDEKGITKRTNPTIQNDLKTNSRSSYLPKNTSLELTFTNATLAILQKNLGALLLSFLFMAALIACLLYLLKVIKYQKQLAEIKNDLISNITHEFKTPIATIGAAVEAIQNFNTENDIEKNQRYAKISSEQVQKLTVMVEKLLETATLDSDALQLEFTTENIVFLLDKTTQKEAISLAGKTIHFKTSEAEILYRIDIFHFENAINNMLDNAIKYGGDIITVSVVKNKSHTTITIQDNGSSLTPVQSKQLFEKFYRVSTGNKHDVKGFGIGLYYTKKIIEKHQGSIKVVTTPFTSFIITLPNG